MPRISFGLTVERIRDESVARASCPDRSGKLITMLGKTSPLQFIFILLLANNVLQCASMNVAPKHQPHTQRLQKNTLTPKQLDELIQSPHIGYVSDEAKSLEIFVIGTSHFRCNSAQEVTTLIEQVQPDGVVLELDPERVLRLTKQSNGFDENGAYQGQQNPEEILYGADFVAAVNACQQMDIPMFLGDEYAQETRQRLTQQFLSWEGYSPAPLVKSLLSSIARAEHERKVRLSLPRTFLQDPQKLAPIAVTSSPPFLFALAFSLFDKGAMAYDGSVITNTLETIVSIIISFLASCLLFNTVIAERDEILAASTVRASNVVRSLKDKTSIRKTWSFTVKKDAEQSTGDTINTSQSLPLFTLKTPLKKAAIRNLNLFEPRWLKMIDQVTKEKDPIFGCVRCTNKFYSAISVNGEEGRYADIIFEKEGTIATIQELKEGKRPVSGDRKVNVAIQGGDSFVVDESNLSVTDDGYMVATNESPTNIVHDGDDASPSQAESSRIVVVVGLLHGNGVVDLLSKS